MGDEWGEDGVGRQIPVGDVDVVSFALALRHPEPSVGSAAAFHMAGRSIQALVNDAFDSGFEELRRS